MPQDNPFDFPGINVKWGQRAGGDLSGAYPNPIIRTITGNLLINGSITLSGSTSGTLVIKPAAVAGTNTLTFPAGTTNFSGTGPGVLRQASSGAAFTVTAANTTTVTQGSNQTTTSLTGVMMGLAGSLTANASGKALVIITGAVSNNTINDGCIAIGKFGTGTAPVLDAAASGTTIASAFTITPSGANIAVPFTIAGTITLTVGTTYWFDVDKAAATGGTLTIGNVVIVVVEIP